MDTAPSLSYSYSNDVISAAVIDQLARTKGWTLFFSVLMWIGAAFLLMGGIAMIGMGAMAGAAGEFGEQMAAQFGAMGGMMAIGVFYFLMAILYIYPALKLGKYSSQISRLMQAPSEQNLVAALNEQRAFWKFVGITTIVMIALYIVFIVVMIVVGIGAAAAGAAAANS